MSNARYFAGGTDFYRVLYPDGSTDGPYIRPSSAKAVGRNATKLRKEYRGWGETRALHREYRVHESFQLQKLKVVPAKCSDPQGLCGKSCLCRVYTLGWVDYNG